MEYFYTRAGNLFLGEKLYPETLNTVFFIQVHLNILAYNCDGAHEYEHTTVTQSHVHAYARTHTHNSDTNSILTHTQNDTHT